MNVNQWSGDMTVIERCDTPRGELQLRQRGQHYEIISNGTFLMATYNGDSERQLVRVPLEACCEPKRVLIGGLGVGFSLQEALQDRRVEQVTVLEIESTIIRWNSSILAWVSDYSLNDKRTRVIEADLVQWLNETDETFDVICLDIDNGPDWTVFEPNRQLYTAEGLLQLKKLLNEGGVLAFWSAASSPHFAERLREVFGHAHQVAVEQERGEPDYVFYVHKRE
ncbi:spermine/spermidine synthase domain-containing protein [Paenibacillus senegalensis]|uniref:spermine/spermidine synthase domain-containing protein n=1 Tax=Paenibacillus senegalensis TaxID=1465766 RepID=UPI0002D701AA|nr:spermine/spermidine synthase [Paenibacillus senegalensis]